jgi:hypothetical protein
LHRLIYKEPTQYKKNIIYVVEVCNLRLYKSIKGGDEMKKFALLMVMIFILTQSAFAGDYLGNLNQNPYDPNSINNPYGAGSRFKSDGVNNPYSKYGSPYSNHSTTNPYATKSPKIVDDRGNYRGRLSTNPYHPESTSNPHGRYGSKYSPDSINNPYGAGNPYSGNNLNLFGE